MVEQQLFADGQVGKNAEIVMTPPHSVVARRFTFASQIFNDALFVARGAVFGVARFYF